jgi:plasmid stabilization system protein ParE
VSLPVRTTPQADAQIREIDAWWRANRTSAADLFLDELNQAFEMIAAEPLIGR